MKKIKKYWKKSYAWKGAIIGGSFGVLVLLINIISLKAGIFQLTDLTGILMVPSAFFTILITRGCNNNLGCLPLIFFSLYLMTPVMYSLIGFLVGWIIEKIRKKK